MEEERSTYHIYLLTVWQEPSNGDGPHWRYRLVDPQTGIDCGFISPHALPHVLQQIQREAAASADRQ